MLFAYPVKLTPAEEGGYVVTCRDLPELVTQGEDLGDALTEAADAMDECFAARISERLDFPAPSTAKRGEHVVSPPVEMVAKAALYATMSAAGISNVDLAQRLGVDEKEVRRMLDPRHRTKLARIEEAVRALGARLVLELV